MTDFIAYRQNDQVCPVCKQTGQVIMEEWQNPRPCPICKGVGQISKMSVPHIDEIEEIMLNYWKTLPKT